MTVVWEARADPDLQVDRILDAVGRLAAAGGVASVTVAAVATEAGCSRPTVYRYFADRDALRLAFVEREARRLGREVAASMARTRDPRRRLVRAVTAALRGVRADPVLRAWVAPDNAGASGALASGSTLLAGLAAWALRPDPRAGSVGDDTGADLVDGGEDLAERAAWLVRVVFSLLTDPGADEREEEAWLVRFVVPVVLPDPGGSGG